MICLVQMHGYMSAFPVVRENSARVWYSSITITPAYEAMSVEKPETSAVTARIGKPLSSSSSQLAFQDSTTYSNAINTPVHGHTVRVG